MVSAQKLSLNLWAAEPASALLGKGVQQGNFHNHLGGSLGLRGCFLCSGHSRLHDTYDLKWGEGVLWATSVVCRSNFGDVCNFLLLEMTVPRSEVKWLRCQKGPHHEESEPAARDCSGAWTVALPRLDLEESQLHTWSSTCCAPRSPQNTSATRHRGELQALFAEKIPKQTRGTCHSSRKVVAIPWVMKKLPLGQSLVTNQHPSHFLLEIWKVPGGGISHRTGERRPMPRPRKGKLKH